MKTNIYISACLAGEPTRYDGKANPLRDNILKRLAAKNNLLPFCPETAGGLGIPRRPCEIIKEFDTDDIYKRYLITDKNNDRVTDHFVKGALSALQYAKKMKIEFAILKNGSPSCGTTYIYDGSFTGRKIRGRGILTYLFEKNNIICFNEKQLCSFRKQFDFV